MKGRTTEAVRRGSPSTRICLGSDSMENMRPKEESVKDSNGL